jgi:hypothetical protein
MHVIDGQAGLIICASLIFYSLTIDNILNIIVLLLNDYLYIIKGDAPFSRRGGDYKNRTSGGIFNINSHNGEGFSSYKSMSC